MKFINKWTLGLAAVGAVSMASAVRADEAKLSQVNTALASTTLSGVVDIGYSQQIGDVRDSNNHAIRQSATFFTPSYGIGKYQDGFSLSQLIVSLDKPLEANNAWSAGYHIDLNAGDAALSGYSSGISHSSAAMSAGIRQAYVALSTPVGNGISWKIGVMDGITGYEGNTLSANPNYSRSYGWQVNPASLVGIIGTYQIIDAVSVQAGFVNRDMSFSNLGESDTKLQSHSYVASVTLTAPDSFGFLKGSALNLQTIQGFDNQSVNNYSASATLATPVAGLKVGLAFDAVQSLAESADGNIWGIYTTYQATDKLNFALRGEYVNAPDLSAEGQINNGPFQHGEEVTATVAYNMWANVLTRVEFRWDHSENETPVYAAGYSNAFLVAANVAYKF